LGERLVSLAVLQVMLLTVQTPSSLSNVELTTPISRDVGVGIEQTSVMPAATPGAPAPEGATGLDGSTAQSTPDQQDIVVKARKHALGDPLESVNARAFAITEGFDRAVMDPASQAYAKAVPEPVQNGISNFLSNLREPVVALNFLLQLKLGKSAETLGRFAINSTLGAAGLFDIAKRRPFTLRHRPNGFADTMGYYGVKPGPYLFLPLLGPSTPRDLVGFVLDRLMLPLAIGSPFNRLTYTVPTSTVNALDRHAAFDEQMQAARASDDPYVARRAFYLKSRQAEIDALRARHHATTDTSVRSALPSAQARTWDVQHSAQSVVAPHPN
jgi:phospholipid-binding lipoprotein MlaA